MSDCNYLQSLEGAIDSSHASFLHSTLDPESNPRLRIGIDSDAYVRTGVPRYTSVEETEYGVMGVSVREGAAGDSLVNVTQFLMPSSVPGGSRGRLNLGYLRTRVPIDDHTSAVFRIWWDPDNPLPAEYVSELQGGEFLVPPMVPGTYRPTANKENDYLIDRVVQRSFNFTGISSFPLQDVAVIENQRGPLTDRTKETLVSSDSLIIQVRRKLLNAARELSEGKEPSLPHTPELFNVPFTQFRVPRGASVEDALRANLEARKVVAA